MKDYSTTTQSASAPPSPAQVIAIASGKGGVGKTSVAANLSIAFAQQGRRVLAMDADLGLSNLDLCFGVSPGLSLLDLMDGSASIEEVLCEGPEGVSLLPGCSGDYELANLLLQERYGLFEAIDTLEDQFDVLLLDTGAGIGSNAVSFAAAASDVGMVVTPDPTSLADAYAFIKVASTRFGVKRFHVIANMVMSVAEGEVVYQRLTNFTDRFLSVGVEYLGFILRDAAVRQSVRQGTPLLTRKPNAPASGCVRRIATRILNLPHDKGGSGGIKLFWRRIAGLREAS